MKEILVLVFVYAGVFLMFVASLGLFRLPDVYTRMSAVTKAVTFKVGLILIGACIFFNTVPIIIKAILIILFLLLTTPVSSHLMAREAYLHKLPLWKKTLTDEFAKYLRTKKKK
ncbi:MAG: monovalent cation/H(+) antiporter subunit G [Bacteroidia bacterium]